MEKGNLNLGARKLPLKARLSKLEARLKKISAEKKALKFEKKSNLEALNVLTEKYKNLLQENKLLSEQKQEYELKVQILQQQLFGKKRDRTPQEENPKVVDYIRNSKRVPERLACRRGRKKLPENQVIDEIKKYDFTDKPACDCCQGEMSYLGSNSSHHVEHKVIIKNVQIFQEKYVCRNCNKIKVANGSKLPIPKGQPLPGMLAQVILDKFSNAMPFYRQAQNFNYGGIKYSRQLLNGWFIKAAELVEPIIELMRNRILKSDYLMCDETGLLLLNKEESKDGDIHMLVVKEGGKDCNFVYCKPIKERNQKKINTLFKDFKGHFQSDGLNIYYVLHGKEGIIAVYCWAHVRRKFVDIAKLSNQKEGGLAFRVLKLIDKLYDIERRCKGLKASRIVKIRRSQSTKILQKIQELLSKHQNSVVPRSPLGRAVKYTIDRWAGLTSYIEDGRIAIDNNATERCIKHFVMGRKNWLFADNMESAEKLGNLYSLIVTCKINDLNPKEYLNYIFKQLPYVNKHNKAELEQLLPGRIDLKKEFDKEYRASRGVWEEIIPRNITEELLALEVA